MEKQTIGDRLYEIRAERDLSYREIARMIGTTNTVWRRWETDETIPSAKVIIAICETFNVSADWLLGLDINNTN